MEITVNGERRRFPEPLDVLGLLECLDIQPRKIAVERNLEIVPRSAFSREMLSDGDRIEIVQFVGGG